MSKKTPLLILLVAVLLVAVFLMLGAKGKKYNWNEHYRVESKDPYGTFLAQNLLKSYFPDHNFSTISGDLAGQLPSGETGSNYFFLGAWMPLDSARTDELLRFVEAGNTAFIASQTIPFHLLDSISRGECVIFTDWEGQDYTEAELDSLVESGTTQDYSDEYPDDSIYEDESYYPADAGDAYFEEGYAVYDSVARFNFSHPSLRVKDGYCYRFLVKNQPVEYNWEYLPPDLFCEGQTVFAILGTLNDSLPTFVKADFGRGAFYLNTTPVAFTNINLLDTAGLEYAEKALSHLPAGDIYWDETRLQFPDYSPNRSMWHEGPLKYILSQPALAWAWYLLLGMAVLFLIFRAKRRQRVIPVLEQNVNTSIEFIGTIGRLTFLQSNHKQLSLQKMRLFLGFVRERYSLPTRDLNEQFVKLLAGRSEVPEEVLNKILTLHRNIENSSYVSETTLVNLHQTMEKFYRQCK
ncbi:MAG: hypothetical protein ACE5FF_02975 [Saprospiraceae bacterium]